MLKVEPLPTVLSTVMSPPHHLAETTADRQAEPGAAIVACGGFVGLREFVEHLADLFRRVGCKYSNEPYDIVIEQY
jgi:hypothetical protein